MVTYIYAIVDAVQYLLTCLHNTHMLICSHIIAMNMPILNIVVAIVLVNRYTLIATASIIVYIQPIHRGILLMAGLDAAVGVGRC
jgi:hypothetical protein